ncbi:hypothetical protein ACTXT7_010599 [Hymenolepis weldensis]
MSQKHTLHRSAVVCSVRLFVCVSRQGLRAALREQPQIHHQHKSDRLRNSLSLSYDQIMKEIK